ncbi:Os02g0198333 [Oryza sativa Japonica Group]|uniref:Os02g0198333 protein n=1 Tax=Oryza sativa subsp. japonica TaxID=39947 RepID=A0A0P0VG29_ORYSJ|nr:hypothetical protein EE612_009534 [Oryza sativa]BAS77484.1 Os02g0198333 [Oryza sativa Japonica Group]
MLSGNHCISSSTSPDSVNCSLRASSCLTSPPATTTALSLTSALSPDLSHRPICRSPSSPGSPNAAAALIIGCRFSKVWL